MQDLQAKCKLGELSLAVLLRVGKINTDDGYDQCYGRNGEFHATVGSVTRNAGILTQSVKGASC